MSYIQICMLAVTGVTACVILRKWNADLLPLLRVAILLILVGVILSWTSPLVAYLKDLTGITALSKYAEFLFKALGIAWLTQCCADICRESGEGGAANGVELAGKVELLLLSLPLINDILTVTKELLSL